MALVPAAVSIPGPAILSNPMLKQVATNQTIMHPSIGTTPTIQVGAGAGNGSGGTATVVANNSSTGGIVTVVTGSANNSTSSIVAAVNMGVTFQGIPQISLDPGSATSANLAKTSEVFAVPTATGFTINSSGGALANSTTYLWNFGIRG